MLRAMTYHTTLGARVSSEALGPTAMDGITIGNINGNLDWPWYRFLEILLEI